MVNLHTTVTRINERFHCRLYEKGRIVNEMACNNKQDVSFCCQTMLRWFDKVGGNNPMAKASRNRVKNLKAVGKIWYRQDLIYNKR